MLKRLAILMALVSASATAWADARSDCKDWKNTPPDRSIATCSEVIRTDARAAWAYNNRGLAYRNKADYERAIADYKKAIEIDPKQASAYNNLANVYQAQGRYLDAEPLHKRSLAIREEALGPDHSDVAQSLHNLAWLYHQLGRYPAGEPLYKRALVIREKVLGSDHRDVAHTLNNLAISYQAQGRYVDAEPLLKRSLAIREKALGPDHSDVAQSLHNLAWLYHELGRYPAGEPLYKRALVIREKVLGSDHRDVAHTLNNLAISYQAQGRYVDAEPLLKRSLAIREKALGPDHSDVAQSLGNVAWLYHQLGRYADAEPLYKRSLAIREIALGPDHPYVASSLHSLAWLYHQLGRYADAEPLYKRSLAIREKALGPDHPDVAQSLNDLGVLYQARGRYADAEPLYKRSLMIREKALGPGHRAVAQSLSNLAWLSQQLGRYADAEPLYKRALAVREKALGPDHPDVANTLINLASLYLKSRKPEEAVVHARKATTAILAHAAAETDATQQADKAGGLIEQRSRSFITHVATLAAAARAGLAAEVELGREGFEIAQWGLRTGAATALAQASARLAKGDSELAQRVRERQDLGWRWQAADRRLSDALGRADAKLADEMRREMASLDARIAGLDSTLREQFPDYAALVNPQPLSMAEAQALLGSDEALVVYLVSKEESFVWALTRDGSAWQRLDVNEGELAKEVVRLRQGLDLEALRKKAEAKEDVKNVLFDLDAAHVLYRRLLGPVESLIVGKRHLIVVPAGALTSLPFQVLVTEKPMRTVQSLGDIAAYAEAPWLIQRHTITILPSVSSLRALRVLAKASSANKPMLGIGDPVFAPVAPAPLRTASARGATKVRGYASYFHGDVADLEALRQGLEPLPETADELKAVAQKLGAPASDLLLGAAATEAAVKAANLRQFRVVYFATHGLVAGEVKGLAEPALVLSLPKQPSEIDDGLLTASEVTQLQLDAEWVVLSACNTAAGETPGAEGLSGLARAFFYAGTRALLVSHWQVQSEATVALTTGTFAAMKANPGIGRAEALRRAMLALMGDSSSPLNPHPAVWAPFVVVGEGGAEHSVPRLVSEPTRVRDGNLRPPQ